MGQVIVRGVHAADEALEEGEVVGGEIAGLDQTNVGADVIDQLLAHLDADDAAVLVAGGTVDHFNELFGLAGTFCAHNYSDHE